MFGAEDATAIVSGRNAEGGIAVVDEITAAGGSARFVHIDLEDAESVPAAAEEAGEVDMLVDNAAYVVSARTLEQDLADLDASFAVNVRGSCQLVQQVAPAMLRKGQGGCR